VTRLEQLLSLNDFRTIPTQTNVTMSPTEHLEDLTNEPRTLRLPASLVDTKRLSSLHAEPPFRIQQLQNLDSSETFPSQHTSIYDAEPVFREKEESLQVSESDDGLNPNVPPSHMPQSPSIENIAPPPHKLPSPAESALRALNVHFSPNRQWPATRLDTITERLSQRTPRTSLSQSRAVSASVDLHLGDAMTTSSINSPPAQRGFETYQRRSFSLNDLDCLKPPKAQHSFVHDSSSSSGDALRPACLCEAYPVHPTEGPPVRIPTPPGLPTFGTREAMEYRMPTAERTSWTTLWRTSRIAPEAARPSTVPPGATATEANAVPPTLTDGLRRLLGITRVVSPIPEEPRRAAMPHYLARADDGTFVRGRFGTRHSAHGSHRGQLDNHPFNREIGSTSGTRQTNLDRVIQEIDKACAETERHRQASASPRAHGQSSPRSGNESPRLLPSGQRALTIAEVLAQQPPPKTLASPNMSLRPAEQSVRSHTSLTFNQVGSGGSIRSQSTIAGIDGVRRFVEQGERVSLEQSRELIKQKKQRSGCANCWFAFWVACCGLEDPDGEIMDSRRVMAPEMRGLSAAQSPEIRPLTRRIVDEQPGRVAEGMLYR
jgi:hypothetical protein